jgi:hypothetical protein
MSDHNVERAGFPSLCQLDVEGGISLPPLLTARGFDPLLAENPSLPENGTLVKDSEPFPLWLHTCLRKNWRSSSTFFCNEAYFSRKLTMDRTLDATNFFQLFQMGRGRLFREPSSPQKGLSQPAVFLSPNTHLCKGGRHDLSHL